MQTVSKVVVVVQVLYSHYYDYCSPLKVVSVSAVVASGQAKAM